MFNLSVKWRLRERQFPQGVHTKLGLQEEIYVGRYIHFTLGVRSDFLRLNFRAFCCYCLERTIASQTRPLPWGPDALSSVDADILRTRDSFRAERIAPLPPSDSQKSFSFVSFAHFGMSDFCTLSITIRDGCGLSGKKERLFLPLCQGAFILVLRRQCKGFLLDIQGLGIVKGRVCLGLFHLILIQPCSVKLRNQCPRGSVSYTKEKNRRPLNKMNSQHKTIFSLL